MVQLVAPGDYRKRRNRIRNVNAQPNEVLSKQRATAIMEHFVVNETLKDDKIVALGYGSKRPLASKDTQEGRAINRRIDVVILPPIQTVQ